MGKIGLGVALLAAPALLVVRTSAAVAQEQRGPVQRVADGKVVDKSDAALAGAVVYLKDTKSLAVKSYLSDEQGHFHFGLLSQNTDYELWAESNGHRSKNKNISSFDSKNAFNFVLKIDIAK